MKSDRRSGAERRRTTRHQMLMELEFEDSNGRHRGTLSDVSSDGCFIMSGVSVSNGDAVSVLIPMSAGMSAQFGGEVANQVHELGFALKFRHLTDAQTDFLVNLMESQSAPDAATP